MEGINTFLESTTIHGLTYISSTRKYARIFWILVVLTGFLGASLLIKESFDSWSESPVKTTIETLPITNIELPKVTVCPPKNTFTDLNYDLMMIENMTLTEKMQDEMFSYAVEVLNEDVLSQNNWGMIHEENRFYNWFNGYTQIKAPSYDHGGNVEIHIFTSATSGIVTTRYYGEKFKAELVDRNLWSRVIVFVPTSETNNENVTQHIKVEKVSMTGLPVESADTAYMDGDLEAEQTSAYTHYTPPGIYRDMWLSRDVSSEDVETQNLEVMTGFRYSWWYTGAEVTPDQRYKDDKITKQYIR